MATPDAAELSKRVAQQGCIWFNAHAPSVCHNRAGEVIKLSSAADLARVAQRPDVMLHISSLLECLRGAAQGTAADAQPALFSIMATCFQPLLDLQRVYHQHEAIVCLLLKLAGDIVEAHVSYLSVSLASLHSPLSCVGLCACC